ncbi:hypothetical protein B0J13DRAFT_445063, partial [Dactylonectria estremocensis]
MSISTAALECAQLLTKAQSNRALNPALRLDLENILVRFKIWAGNVGVFAPEHASVDYRLRQDADVTEVLLSMLTSLKATLERTINPPHLEEFDEGVETSPSTASSSSSSLTLDSDAAEEHQVSETLDDLGLSDPIRRANDVVDRLYRLVHVIRKPVSSTENSKVRDFIAKQISRGENEDLEDAEDHARRHMEARFPKASKILVDRLVAAVVFRRMKLRYRQRHQEKLRQGVDSLFVTDTSDATKDRPIATSLPVSSVTQLDFSSHGKETPSLKPVGSVAWSATNASSVNKARFVNYAKSMAVSGITRSAVARRQQLDVPLPPQDANKGLDKITCSYCMRMISREETQEPRWTRHILKDINPYVCLFEHCNQGEVLFTSDEEWLGHMQWEHTVVWCCQVSGHEEHIYGSEAELKEHIEQGHPGSFTESQLPHLVRQGAMPAADTFAGLALSFNPEELAGQPAVLCPICHDFPPSSAENVDPSAKGLPDIQSHIMGHLESIALLSLPQEDHPDGAESIAKQASENRTAAVRDIVGLP